MDVIESVTACLPDALDAAEELGQLETDQLWLLARGCSRRRHRASPRRDASELQRWETLKRHCVRLAVARAPELFLVFVDPEFRHLLIVYHRIDRSLLHVPLEDFSPSPTTKDGGEKKLRPGRDPMPTLVDINKQF
jgi:hypothetical protein